MTLKRDHQCPACSERLILRIESVRTRHEAGLSPLPVACKDGFWLQSGQGGFETFICKGCGFTEWYAYGLEQIEPDPARGIHLIDARPSQTNAPFR